MLQLQVSGPLSPPRILCWRWSHHKLAAIPLRRQHPPKAIATQQLPYWELVKLLFRLLVPLSPRRIFRWRWFGLPMSSSAGVRGVFGARPLLSHVRAVSGA